MDREKKKKKEQAKRCIGSKSPEMGDHITSFFFNQRANCCDPNEFNEGPPSATLCKPWNE